MPKIALGIYAAQSVLLGLKWTYGISSALLLQVTFAAMIPPLTWLSMLRLVSTRYERITPERMLLHFLPAILIFLSPVLRVPAIDFIIVTVFLAYGVALLMVGWKEDLEWRDRVPFQGIMSTNIAFMGAGAGLLISASVDIFVTYDISRNGGALSPEIVGVTSFVLLVILGLAVATVGQVSPRLNEIEDGPGAALAVEAQHGDAAPQETRAERLEALRRLDALMNENKAYRDANLSLDRLARKLVVPSRLVSSAINKERAMNVSQYVNTFRTMEACELLQKTDRPVTEIIFDVGFQTKSNFNREFSRIMGMSPSEWRKINDPEAARTMADFRTHFFTGSMAAPQSGRAVEGIE